MKSFDKMTYGKQYNIIKEWFNVFINTMTKKRKIELYIPIQHECKK